MSMTAIAFGIQPFNPSHYVISGVRKHLADNVKQSVKHEGITDKERRDLLYAKKVADSKKAFIDAVRAGMRTGDAIAEHAEKSRAWATSYGRLLVSEGALRRKKFRYEYRYYLIRNQYD
jgi:hypothetical protein